MDDLLENWPFSPKTLRQPSFLQRLMRRRPIDNAVTSINNLLADCGGLAGLAELQPQQFTGILESFRVAPQRVRSDLQTILSALIVFVLENVSETQGDAELARIASLFPLERSEFAVSRANAQKEAYGRAVDRYIEDGRLSRQEKLCLEALQSRFALSEEDVKTIYSNCAQRRISRFIQFISEDQRITPVEDKRLGDMAQSLGVTLQFDENSRRLFERYRTMWAIENGELPEVVVTTPLKRDEVCHFTADCSWHEYRVTSTTVVYGGFRYSTKIIKGLYAVGGVREYRPVHQESLIPVDSGAFYVTSNRVMFVGSKKGISIPLDGIAEVSMFSDGLMLRRNAGKNPFIKFDTNVDICVMILARLVGQ